MALEHVELACVVQGLRRERKVADDRDLFAQDSLAEGVKDLAPRDFLAWGGNEVVVVCHALGGVKGVERRHAKRRLGKVPALRQLRDGTQRDTRVVVIHLGGPRAGAHRQGDAAAGVVGIDASPLRALCGLYHLDIQGNCVNELVVEIPSGQVKPPTLKRTTPSLDLLR